VRKPEVDYRQLRLSRLGEPRFAHLKLLLGWVGYFALYLLTENLIPPERCHVIHSPLDDLIPFWEGFVVAYVFWYVLIVGSLLFFLLYEVDSFRRLQIYIIVTQVVAMAVYILYPSRQDLRPAVFPRENVFTWVLGIIYSVDTPTGVFPSLHVAYSLGIASAWLKSRAASPWVKGFVTAAALVICVSVAFVKQHSVLDIFSALPLCLLAEAVAFGDWWRKRLRR